MALDPTNPALPAPAINPETLAVQQRVADAFEKHAQSAELMAASTGETPVTEAGVYLKILLACITARVATTSDDMQIWATDLTRDYLIKYPLPSSVPPA